MLRVAVTGAVALAFVWGAPEALAARDLIPRSPPAKPIRTIVRPGEASPHVIVKFVEGSGVRVRHGRLEAAAGGPSRLWLEEVARVLRSFGIGSAAIERQHARAEAELDAERALGQRRSGRALADLNLYYRIRTPPGTDLGALCDALNALPLVELAEPQPAAYALAVDLDPPTPGFTPEQAYGSVAPRGVWMFHPHTPGVNGAGTTLVDIEFDWILDHEDLELPPQANIDSATLSDPWGDSADHGTAVLAIVGALYNEYGVTGIAPGARLLVAPASTEEFGSDVARAIGLALGELDAGDAILLELQGSVCGQLCDPDTQQGCGPLEYSQSVYDPIETATALGVTVVEAAGNGGSDLDSASCLGRFNRSVRDSGAILVGAGGEFRRNRLGFSNYGSRVDVQGWGEAVVTAGYGNKFFTTDPRQRYTYDFSGTSSAAAIVAGAVLAVQGAALTQGLGPLDPGDLRALLVATGSPQKPGETTHIGPLPSIFDAVATLVSCGDGVVDPTEQCDDGNPAGGDGCDASCDKERPSGCLLPGDLIAYSEDTDAFGDNEFPRGLLRIDPVTGEQAVITVDDILAQQEPRSIAVEPSGDLVFAASPPIDPAYLVRVDPETGSQQFLSIGDLVQAPIDMEVEADGGVLVANTNPFGPSPSQFVRVDPGSGDQEAPSGLTALRATRSMALLDRFAFVAASYRIYKFDSDFQQRTLLTPGTPFDAAPHIAAGVGGELYAFDFLGDGGLFQVDPNTGEATLLSPTDGSLPSDLAAEATDTLVVADPVHSAIVRADLANGLRFRLTAHSQLKASRDVAVVPPGGGGCPGPLYDSDADSVRDPSDSCPATPNVGQEDAVGVGASGPDGIGDACQCGDVVVPVGVDETDVGAFRIHLADPEGEPFDRLTERKCDVSPVAGVCDIVDVALLMRALHAPPLSPGLAQSCAAAIGP